MEDEIKNRKLIRERLHDMTDRYRELVAYYRCAMMEVETKFRVLDEELSLRYDRDPIETIKTRIKSFESTIDKLERLGLPMTVESIEDNMHDMAGVRVICSFIEDIYTIADAFLGQDDVTLVEYKDYINNPKDNGYRSLHLIVEIPIFLHDKKKAMKVEVQLRTISMDFWASLEHKIRYKKDVELSTYCDNELAECAKIANDLDIKMQTIYNRVKNR